MARRIDVPCEEEPCQRRFITFGELETLWRIVSVLYAIAFWGVISLIVILILLAVISHAA
ncbi:MAG: hypothetical protein KDA86_25540 [Planctomycetaceae bacterium]|nr:hypothetical protein [Planctomycetaceae bacterium]